MWSVARFDLGLAEAEFWRLTPRQFEALTKRRDLAQQQLDHRAGVVAAAISNAFGGKKGKPIQPSDFFSSLKKAKGAGSGRKQSTAQQLAVVQMFHAMATARAQTLEERDRERSEAAR